VLRDGRENNNTALGQMRFRKLRIAFSATCLIACVLLIVLWVQSYWLGDCYSVQIKKTWFSCSDLRGCIVLTCFDATKRSDIHAGYSWGRAPRQRLDNNFPVHFYGFYFKKSTSGLGLVVPVWFLMVVSIGCAVAPWLSWRFSLRTLLIATMLLAIVLGLSVVLSR
jgi:hypothetical protein